MKLKLYPEKKEFLKLTERGNLIPVCLDILADTETPLSALAKIYDGKGPVFLLESVEGGERWGRYSFLGLSSRCTVRVYREKVVVEEGSARREVLHHGDPLSVMRSLMSGYRPVSLPGLPRFWGGMVGFLTYEAVSFFEDIPNRCSDETLLAHFVIPDQLFVFDNIRHTLSLVAYAMVDGEDPGEVYDAALKTIDFMQGLLRKPLPEERAMEECPLKLEPIVEPESFRNQVSRIKEYITDGDVIQTVLSQPFVCTPPARPLAALPRSTLRQSISLHVLSPFRRFGAGGLFPRNHGAVGKRCGDSSPHCRYASPWKNGTERPGPGGRTPSGPQRTGRASDARGSREKRPGPCG